MEAIISSGTDQRIPQLDVAVYQDQSSYILSRHQTQTTCSTPVLSPNAVRTAKFSIVDGNFLDLSTLSFSFTIKNNDANNALRPLNAIPSNWFRRLIIKVNGTTCEDQNNLARTERQIEMFVSKNKRRNWGDAGSGWEVLTDSGIDALPKVIPAGGSKRVTWRPLGAGFLNCGKYLPSMGTSGLTVELELADLSEACLNHGTNSVIWQLENMQINIDSVTLTSEMTNNFADMLIRGESIMISYSTCDSQKLYLNGGANQVLSVAKQFSRLASVSVSFTDTIGNPSADNAVGCNEKEVNKFYLASASSEVVESNIQVNNMRWPI